MISKKIFTIKDDDFYDYGKEGAFIFLTAKGSVNGVYTCREKFNYDWIDEKFIGFSADNLDIHKLNEFWEYIETKLKISLKNRTILFNSNIKNTKVLKVSSFWSDNIIRKHAFSLFLRCGTYYQGDFNKSLNDYKLTKQVKNAVNLFLNGYNKPNIFVSPLFNRNRYFVDDLMENLEETFGFVNYFKGLSDKEIKEMLVLDKKRK